MKIKHHPATPCNFERSSCDIEIPLIDEKWGLSFPEKMEIELTRECNLKCIHCWNNSSRNAQELPFYLIEREINNAPDTLHIKLTGGEPLLYSSFKNLVDLCKEKGHLVEIVSNGTQITPEVVKYLNNKISKINISLHGTNPKIHEKITRIPGSYNQTIRSIELMKEQGVNLTINYTVMKENMGDIKDIMHLTKSLGVQGLRLNVLRDCGRGKRLEKILPEEIKKLRKEINSIQLNIGVNLERSELYTRPYNVGLENAHVYGCGGMRNSVFINSDANVYPCSLSQDIIGNLNQNTLEKIWNSKEASNFRKIFLCPKEECNLKKYCAGKCKI